MGLDSMAFDSVGAESLTITKFGGGYVFCFLRPYDSYSASVECKWFQYDCKDAMIYLTNATENGLDSGGCMIPWGHYEAAIMLSHFKAFQFIGFEDGGLFPHL